MPVKIIFSREKVETRIKYAFGAGMGMLANEILNDCNQYCKEDTGMLIASSMIHSRPKEGKVIWQTISPDDEVVEVNGDKLTALKEGETVVWACTEANENIGVIYEVYVYENADDMVKVTFDEANTDCFLSYEKEEGKPEMIPYSGFLVKKGTEVEVNSMPTTAKTVLCILANNKYSASDIINSCKQQIFRFGYY